jgi:hypothetical protein
LICVALFLVLGGIVWRFDHNLLLAWRNHS